MKNILLVLIVLLAVSCKKYSSETLPEAVYGSWEIRSEQCGFSGLKTYLSGNGAVIILYSNGSYQSTFGGAFSGNYTVTQRLSSSQQMQWYIYFDGNWKHEYRMQLNSGILTIDNADVIADGCSYTFERF